MLKRSALAGLAVFSAGYLVLFVKLALFRGLWYDELFTYYVAKLPSMTEIWRALVAGADPMGPPFHYVSHAFLQLPLDPVLALRLPAILGVGAMGMALYAFVARRLGPVYGFIAMLFPLSTQVAHYATEARAYGMVLGLTAVAALCWQTAAEGRHRAVTLCGLSVCLSLAIGSHYFALLVLGPFVVAEIVRSIELRRVDWGVAVALVSSFWILIPLWSHFQVTRSYGPHFWAKPELLTMASFFGWVVTPGLIPLWGVALVVMTWSVWRKQLSARVNIGFREAERYRVPRHELAFAFSFLALPPIAVSIGIVTGFYTDRYVLPAVVGFSMMAAYAIEAMAGTSAAAACVALLSCLGWVAGIKTITPISTPPAALILIAQKGAYEDTPIAIAMGTMFLEFYYRSPPELAKRLRFVSSPEIAIRRTGTDSLDRALEVLAQWAPMRVEPVGEFLKSHESFLVFDPPGGGPWLIPELLDRHYQLEWLSSEGGTLYRLSRMTAKPPTGSP